MRSTGYHVINYKSPDMHGSDPQSSDKSRYLLVVRAASKLRVDMGYRVLVLCAVVCCAVAAPLATPFSACPGFSGDITVTNVSLPGCNSAPCVLKKGTTVSGSVSFKASVQETDVTNKVYGIIAGVPVPFPLPEADACKLGVTCPISANTAVTEVVSIPISKAYPSISLIAKWELLDASGKEQGCFEVPFKIES